MPSSNVSRRQICQVCGARMTHRGKSEPAPNGHHRTVFYCPECDDLRARG